MSDEWDIKIRQVSNGFLVSVLMEMVDGDDTAIDFVIGGDRDLPPDKYTALLARDLCNFIIEQFGLGGSKHDKYRINISVDGEE